MAFPNIKMNKIIKDLPYENFFVQPSGGDESLAMGGCYLEEKLNSKPLKNISGQRYISQF